MPKKVSVAAKRIEALERDDFVIIYTEFGLQFLRCVLSTGRSKKDKIFEIWVPNEDHSTFSNQSSTSDAILIDCDYDVVHKLWESGWCLLIPPKLYSMNNYLLKGTFKGSLVNYVLNNNAFMGADFFTIDTFARELLFKSCHFNFLKSSSSSYQQPERTTSSARSKKMNIGNKGNKKKDKVPFRQFPKFDSDDSDDSDVQDSEDDDATEDDESTANKSVKRKATKRPVARVARKAQATVGSKVSKGKASSTPFRLEDKVMANSAMRKTVKSNNIRILSKPNAVDKGAGSSSKSLISGVFEGTADIAQLIREGLDTAANSATNYIYGSRAINSRRN